MILFYCNFCWSFYFNFYNYYMRAVSEIEVTFAVPLSGLSQAVQRFSQSLQEFQFECIGDAETDDEINIGGFELIAHYSCQLYRCHNCSAYPQYMCWYRMSCKRNLPAMRP